ncbi:MAG TPA: asparagine synthase (glutamine-hydrolyzing), partial [Acidimicrobiaceae bacterium]|nr:asparagine synthase (glutamine-hydrolyzing) [Acidimicrobiaceae bacterium]
MALAFRRLSVVDLSPSGLQPMPSASGRYIAVYNGELYNTDRLRAQLGDQRWRGTSDTEVLLAAIDRWGLVEALRRADGMFALAVWDRHEHTLTLARDRMGEKPLYYGVHDGVLLFGSELKAVRAHPAFRAAISTDALAAYAYAGYVPTPLSIYEHTWKVPHGSWVQFTAAHLRTGTLPAPQAYWSLPHNDLHADGHGAATDDDAIERLDAVLRDAVQRTMVADVPLGAFLSGGIDSSTIVAIMQATSSQPVRTFTIGLPHAHHLDESVAAARVARHLRTEHTTLDVTPADALAVVPSLPTLYDEPFADHSQIPTHLVAALARRHVTVALSGDGGDELFGGYTRYQAVTRVVRAADRVPSLLQRPVAVVMRGAARLLPHTWHDAPGARLARVAHLLPARSAEQVYRDVFAVWPDGSSVVSAGSNAAAVHGTLPNWPTKADPVAAMMRADQASYLPDDICAKVDRAAMAVSLETRMPFLHRNVVEFAATVPAHQRIRGGDGKWLLRQVLGRYVPRELFDRPKAGFGVPLDDWLRTVL